VVPSSSNKNEIEFRESFYSSKIKGKEPQDKNLLALELRVERTKMRKEMSF